MNLPLICALYPEIEKSILLCNFIGKKAFILPYLSENYRLVMPYFSSFLCCFISVYSIFGQASELPCIPRPNKVTITGKYFSLHTQVVLQYNSDDLKNEIVLFQKGLLHLSGINLPSEKNTIARSGRIMLILDKSISKPKEGYTLQIQDDRIILISGDNSGIFYGLQTLLHIMEKGPQGYRIPTANINDYPRFAYRGLMLDVARHFREVDYLKKLLDQMALLKLNTFHWHLTDDQGWRIEIKKYPKLTETGAWRDGTIIGGYPGSGNDNFRHGGFYTQEQVKEIVAYAAARHITVIPEIEMPGHSSAAIAAYPWLSCFPEEETNIPKHPSEGSKLKKGKKVQESWGVYEDVFIPSEETFSFLQDIIDEVVPLFPGQYIHIGGDECPKENWKRSAFCQNIIREKGLKNEYGLQSYFIGRMEKYISAKGKKVIGWDEILEGGLAANAIVMSWRGDEGGIEAARQLHEVVMSPTGYCYFDYSQTKNEDSIVIGGYLPLEKVYSYNPVPKQLQGTEFERFVQGAQGNVWTEYMRGNSKVDYMIFPRIAALAESVWTETNNKNWTGFEKRLPRYFFLLENFGVNYSKAFYSIQSAISPNASHSGVVWSLNSKYPDAKIFVALPGQSDRTPFNGSIDVSRSGLYTAWLIHDSRDMQELKQIFTLHKAVGRKVTFITPPSSKYPGNGGGYGIINGAVSHSGMRSPEWLGWDGEDMNLSIDLQKSTDVSGIRIHILDLPGAWIYPPSEVYAELRDEKNDFLEEARIGIKLPDNGNTQKTIHLDFSKPLKARYVKLMVKNYGLIPSGKPGAGHMAWLFSDEVELY